MILLLDKNDGEGMWVRPDKIVSITDKEEDGYFVVMERGDIMIDKVQFERLRNFFSWW